MYVTVTGIIGIDAGREAREHARGEDDEDGEADPASS
jgi:hypothetical protein